MDPVTAVLSAAALAGAIIGGKRKHIDPEWLKAHYGANAISTEAQALFARVINSPVGQSIMNSASEAGQQFGRSTQAQAAAAGMTPASGAATGTGIFATGAGEGAANALQTQARGNIYQSVLPIAEDLVAARRDAYLQDFYNNGAPSDSARTWSQVGNAAGVALAAGQAAKATPGASTASATNIGAPGAKIPGGMQPALGAPMVGGPAAGFRPLTLEPRPGFLQKGRRLMSGTGSRFAQALSRFRG